jgi:ParB family chromosome partitioning protein
MTILNVPLDKILANPWQTRSGVSTDGEHVHELAQDIARNGLLQSPVGRIIADGSIQLAFGHNRLAAYFHLRDLQEFAEAVDYKTMPVDVRELTDEQMADFAWSENEKRRNVNPRERALAIQQRINDFGWSQEQVAEHLGLSRPVIANALRLLKLPADMQAALSDGSLSERQGMALLPLFDLGNEILTKANNLFSSSYYYQAPKEIIAQAVKGKLNSDQVREKVEQIYRQFTRNLQDAEWKLNELIPEGGKIYCGLCRTCDKRLASRNQCLDRECFEAKTAYVHRQYLERASQASGIKVIDELKGGYPTDITGSHFDKIIGTGCENLRLIYQAGDKRSNSIDDYPCARIVCDKRNLACTCLKGLQMQTQTIKLSDLRDLDSDEEEEADVDADCGSPSVADAEEATPAAPIGSLSSAELEEIARQSRRAKKDAFAHLESARNLLAERLTRDLINQAPGALYAVDNGYWYPNHENLKLERIYRSMANSLANRILPSSPDSVEDLERRINNILSSLELEPISLTKPLVEVLDNQEEVEGDENRGGSTVAPTL